MSHPDFELTEKTFDLHSDPVLSKGNIMTEYEERFSSAGHPICMLKAVRK
jgi:tRNA (guanine-N7-)-methyltransferase